MKMAIWTTILHNIALKAHQNILAMCIIQYEIVLNVSPTYLKLVDNSAQNIIHLVLLEKN